MFFPKKRLICLLVTVFLLLSCTPVRVAAAEHRPILILDAGHGGEDGGAVSADGIPESGINLQITKKVQWLLLLLGYDTLLTREGEDAVYSPEAATLREKKVSDLNNRVSLINGTETAFVISIHQNSLPSHPRVHGAKVFYNTVQPAERAGNAVQGTLNLAVNAGNERPVTAIDSTIYLMKESIHPAILVECGFMSNPEECKKLQDSAYQLRLSVAVTAGFAQFDTAEHRSIYEE